MIDLTTNRPSAYDGLYGYINLSKWVKNQGGLVIDEILTDHNNKKYFITYGGDKIEYDYYKRSEIDDIVSSYYNLSYNIDHAQIKEKLEQFKIN